MVNTYCLPGQSQRRHLWDSASIRESQDHWVSDPEAPSDASCSAGDPCAHLRLLFLTAWPWSSSCLCSPRPLHWPDCLSLLLPAPLHPTYHHQAKLPETPPFCPPFRVPCWWPTRWPGSSCDHLCLLHLPPRLSTCSCWKKAQRSPLLQEPPWPSCSALQSSRPHSLTPVIFSLVGGVAICVDAKQCGGVDRTRAPSDTLSLIQSGRSSQLLPCVQQVMNTSRCTSTDVLSLHPLL